MKKLFDEIPYLEDERIVLKKIEEKDAKAIRRMTESSEVYRYLPTFLFELQYEDIKQMIRELYGDLFYRKESLIMGIYLKESLSFCGMAEFYGYKDSIHKVCIGYRLMKDRSLQLGWSGLWLIICIRRLTLKLSRQAR